MQVVLVCFFSSSRLMAQFHFGLFFYGRLGCVRHSLRLCRKFVWVFLFFLGHFFGQDLEALPQSPQTFEKV